MWIKDIFYLQVTMGTLISSSLNFFHCEMRTVTEPLHADFVAIFEQYLQFPRIKNLGNLLSPCSPVKGTATHHRHWSRRQEQLRGLGVVPFVMVLQTPRQALFLLWGLLLKKENLSPPHYSVFIAMRVEEKPSLRN